ncbi:uncharacterized protein LOC143044636 [Mytilus galloprovincialis]|uniref:uncharacterized protein LOC143044636 n=1 Tax=Mytilus galloprovincialis TaxID=29158 RepID=UPI003F7B6AE3
MNWTPIRMGEASPREIPHGLGVPPAYVVLQIKLGSTEDVADGIGYMMAIESSLKGDKWGGVPYAYDDKNIRVWTRYIGGSLFAIPEGWGNSKENFKSGQYRIFAWKSLKAKTKTVQKLSLPSRSNTEIRFHTGINQTCDIVQVMVKELPNRSGSNENAGYLFKATGAVQNTRANNSYGGVVYSYSSQSLRVWYPPVNDTGKNYLVYLDNLFGKSSTATRAELEITTLVPYDAIPKTTSKEMTASLLPITKRITQLQQKSTRDRTLHLTTKSKTTSHSDTLTTTSSMAITASSIPITRGTARLLQKSTESPKLTTKNKTTLHSAKEDMTDTLCQFDFWIYILIGFGICLVPVFIIWLFWFCLRSVSKDAKVSIE